jgi:ADP-ribose pyrophosphatase YjhB (NUDIX family)
MQVSDKCPNCGQAISLPKQPALTVDVIIEMPATNEERDAIVLIKRKNPPYGWALPGGFVDYGETVEAAAIREAKEETSIDVELLKLLGVYSDPRRDPRGQTVSVVFIAKGRGGLRASDDAADAALFTKSSLPAGLAFDHDKILRDYFLFKDTSI